VSARQIGDRELARTARAWLAYQDAQDPQYEWAMHKKEEWFAPAEYTPEDFEIMSRFVRQVCIDVTSDDEHGIGMIGASPLEDFIYAYRERALSWVEVEVETNVILREALTGVWPMGRRDVRQRIDEILALYGKTGASK
jgi:hypothetical protein